MKSIILQNDNVEAIVNYHGAELSRLKNKKTGKDYLWNADPAFWNRSSPVLFPFVGQVKDGRYLYEGQEYPMGQHGFARDMDFSLMEQSEKEVVFSLESNEETLKKYPFDFRLEIGYELTEHGIIVKWHVVNTGGKEMYFSIGAHPAFFCPFEDETQQSEYYISLKDGQGKVVNEFVNSVFGQGLLTEKKEERRTEAGLIPIEEHLFDQDALVIEEDQVKEVALLRPDQSAYLRVTFDAPLVGIWSPPKKHAPFVCIEPWYGRCDKETFQGTLAEREWSNTLAPKEEFSAEYRIELS